MNGPTYVVLFLIGAAVFLAGRHIYRHRGENCSGACSGCGHYCHCHKEKKQEHCL